MSPYTEKQGFKYPPEAEYLEQKLMDVMKTNVVESSAASSVQRATTKPITCPACGHVNLIQRKLYNWLLTKEKHARCRNCGRSIPLTE